MPKNIDVPFNAPTNFPSSCLLSDNQNDEHIVYELMDSNEKFVEYVHALDNHYGTYTKFASMRLRDIWNIFGSKQHNQTKWYADTIEEYSHQVITYCTELARGHGRSVLYSSDPDLKSAAIGKFNAFYLFKKDRQQGRKFLDPISVDIKNTISHNAITIHPGCTRLMYADLVDDYINVVVTMETPSLESIIQSTVLEPIENMTYDFNNSPMMLRAVKTIHPSAKQTFNKNTKIVCDDLGLDFEKNIRMHKCLVDYNREIDGYTYHRPLDVDPTLKFEIFNDAVTVGDELVAMKTKGFWRVVI